MTGDDYLSGNEHRLAMARELARIYRQVLERPLPEDLRYLI